MSAAHPLASLRVLTSLAALALLAAALFLLPSGAQAQTTSVCDRTPEVETWILRQIPSATNCADVTTTQLNGIAGESVTVPFVSGSSIPGIMWITGYSNPTLLSSDFAGLTGIRAVLIVDSPALRAVPSDAFDGLTEGSLTHVLLPRNGIKAIGPGAFNGMTAVTRLDLRYNDIVELPEPVFSGLTAMTSLVLRGSRLTALPSDLFDGLTALDNLDLSSNSLTTLPADIFAGLDLQTIDLRRNKITSLPRQCVYPH